MDHRIKKHFNPDIEALRGDAKAFRNHCGLRSRIKFGKERLNEKGELWCNICSIYHKPENYHDATDGYLGKHSYCKHCTSIVNSINRLEARLASNEEVVEASNRILPSYDVRQWRCFNCKKLFTFEEMCEEDGRLTSDCYNCRPDKYKSSTYDRNKD